MLQTIRVWFRKTGTAKYISHLDLNRCMARAVKRAGIPAWYTEGFNPHLFLTFSLPLALGVEGEMESMDMKIAGDISIEEIQNRLNACLPQGLYVTGVTMPVKKPGEIAAADYEILMTGFVIPLEDAEKKVQNFLNREHLMVFKKTKTGSKEVDLKQALQAYSIDVMENTLRLCVTLPAGSSENVNPSLLLDTMLAEWETPPLCQVKRLTVKDGAGNLFL